MFVDFREPWVAVGQYAENLTQELQREVTEGHPLWRKDVNPLAQRIDSDDVLLEIAGEPKIYAVVHLTWRRGPEHDNRWPDKRFFSSLDEWIRESMMPDHQAFSG